jgi:YecR-like lipoprotein
MKPTIFAAVAAAAALCAAGCTTYKLWEEFDSDAKAGTLQLAYEFRRFESPQVDERAAIETARERCGDWGYKNAHRSGEDRICIDGPNSGCGKWRVVRTYRCTAK